MWFQQVLLSAFVGIASDRYMDFAAAARGALRLLATRRRVVLPEDDESTVLRGMAQLSPHPDVAAGLNRLQAAGFD